MAMGSVEKSMWKSTYVKMLLVAVFWGGAFATGKLAVAEMHPLGVAFYRFLITTLCLVPLMLWKDRAKAKLAPGDWRWMVAMGLTGIFGYNALFFLGLKSSSAINATAIIAAGPMATALLNRWVNREKMLLRQVFGILISFIGVLTVVTEMDFAKLELNAGDIYLLGAVLSWATYTLIGRKIMQRYSALTTTAYASVFGTAMFIPFVSAVNGFTIVMSGTVWLSILYMAIFSSVIAFVWWNVGVKEIGPTRSVIFINLVPIFATLGALFIGEKLYVSQVVGMIIVIAGVLLTNLPQAKPLKKASPQNTV